MFRLFGERFEHVALTIAEQEFHRAILPALEATRFAERVAEFEVVGGGHGLQHLPRIAHLLLRDARESIFIAGSKSPVASFAIAPVNSLMIRLIHTSCTWWIVMNSVSSCASVSGACAPSSCSMRR